MNIAVVCECDPFHLNCLHRIKEIRKVFPKANIIAVMSGNIVQRGEFSVLDKLYKTEITLEYRIDNVIEIPSVFSLQSARNFEYYAIEIVDAVGCDYVSFGIESEVEDLISFKNFLLENNDNIEQSIYNNKNLSCNKSIMGSSKQNYIDYSDEVFRSNNVLALKYIESLGKVSSSHKILPIKRINSDYNSNSIKNISYSVSSIRSNVELLGQYESKAPALTYKFLKNGRIEVNNKLLDILSYKLLIKKYRLDNITGYEKGLENLLTKGLDKNYRALFESIKNRKYSQSRLKRLVLNYILRVDKEFVDDILKKDIEVIRLSGFNKNFDLSVINKNCKICSLTRDFSRLSEGCQKLSEFDIEADRLIYPIRKVNDSYDFPIIEK